jgi:hypothetical protein
MSTWVTDKFGRLTTFINDISLSGTYNVVTLINRVDSTNVSKMNDIVSNVKRIRYISDVINNLINIKLMIVIIDGAEYQSIIDILREVGDSTVKGDGTKPVGDLSIFWDIVNKLGYEADGVTERPPFEQQKINVMLNDVEYCGIQSGYDLNSPWAHLIPQPCSSGINRMSEFMLGMNDAMPVSVITGDVTIPSKTVKILNGIRDINKMIDLINTVPGEVMSTLTNSVDNFDNVMYGSLLYMLNRLSAHQIAGLMHFGTGIGARQYDCNCDWLGCDTCYDRYGTCRYFTGFGPARMANLLNAEPGTNIKPLLDKFGWRTAGAAMVCGFGVSSQSIPNENNGGTVYFAPTETLTVNNDPTYGTYTHRYDYASTPCTRYYPENLPLGMGDVDDYMYGEIGGMWDIVMCRGWIGEIGCDLMPLPSSEGSNGRNYAKCRTYPQRTIEYQPPVRYTSPQSGTPMYSYPDY